MAGISIVVPVYNEQDNIRVLTNSLIKALEPEMPDYEIIFVDDASTDLSLRIIKELSGENQRIKYLSFSRNFGQQAALTAGLDFATGDAIITMDADLQDPPRLIPEMIQAWQNGNDIVLMRRRRRNDGLFKRITAGLYYFLLDKFSDNKQQGNVGEFRLISKKVGEELRTLKEKTRYLRGMISWMGYTFTFIDYDRPNRTRPSVPARWGPARQGRLARARSVGASRPGRCARPRTRPPGTRRPAGTSGATPWRPR